MQLNQLLRVIRRWFVVMILAVVVVTSVAYWRARSSEAMYESSVRLQFTAPQPENVVIGDASRSSTNVRDDITVAENNFTSLLQSREVFDRVIKQLGLTGTDAEYKIDVRPVKDADYFDIVAQSKNSGLVGQIANVHVNIAIAYYGEVRAKPAAASKAFLAEQVAAADKRVRTAESALSDFQAQNHVTNISSDLDIDQRVLQDLMSERNNRVLNGPSSKVLDANTTLLTQLKLDREAANAEGNAVKVAKYDESILAYTQAISQEIATLSPLSVVDDMITQYRNDINRLTALQPRYTTLQGEMEQARSDFQQTETRYNNAVVAEQSAQNANFIQVIQPGLAPDGPVPSRAGLVVVLALIAGVIVGIVLAFVMDYLFPYNLQPTPPVPAAPRKVNKKVDIAQTVRQSVPMSRE